MGVTVTPDNVTELEAWVSSVSARDEALPEVTAGNNAGWLTLVRDKIIMHRSRWAAMPPEERADLLACEQAIGAFYERERVSSALKQTQRKRNEHLKRSGVRLTDEAEALIVSGGSGDTAALHAVVDWYGKRSKPWLVLSGLTGCGKSYAAAEWIVRYGGLWMRADEMVRVWWANFGEQYERQDAVRNASLLVIDDIGCELDAGRMQGVLLDLFDSRKSARAHPTIVTTNLTKTAFVERYADARLLSRMGESVAWSTLEGAGDLRRGPR